MIRTGIKNIGRATVLLTALALIGLAAGCSPKGNSPGPTTGSEGAVDTENLVAARLVTDVDSFQAGTPFRLGVVFRIAPKTHVYYRDPGSSGLPTEVAWTLPEGFEAGPLQYPDPERFEDVDLGDISYGYEDEVLLFSEVTPSDAAAESTVSFEAHATWLACMEDGLCIPGDAKLTLVLAPGTGGPSAEAETFANVDVPAV